MEANRPSSALWAVGSVDLEVISMQTQTKIPEPPELEASIHRSPCPAPTPPGSRSQRSWLRSRGRS